MSESGEHREDGSVADAEGPADTAPPSSSRPRRTLWIALVAALVVIAGLVTAWALRPAQPTASAPSPTVTATPTPTPTPTLTAPPTPTPTGFPANTASYDLSALPQANVFTVLAALPVDDQPFGSFTGEQARALGSGAPVFADPTGQPVAYLPREYA